MEICSKFHWMSWIGVLVRRVANGDVAGAANVLACCLGGWDDEPALVVIWRNKMFRHACLEGRHQEIWAAMKPLIVPEYRATTKKMLREKFSWSI